MIERETLATIGAFALATCATLFVAILATINQAETSRPAIDGVGLQMNDGIRYEHSRGPTGNQNVSGMSAGVGFRIQWRGQARPAGAEPITVLQATLEHLQSLQKTVEASEGNAKLIAALVPALEEYEGATPTMGGKLNDQLGEILGETEDK